MKIGRATALFGCATVSFNACQESTSVAPKTHPTPRPEAIGTQATSSTNSASPVDRTKPSGHAPMQPTAETSNSTLFVHAHPVFPPVGDEKVPYSVPSMSPRPLQMTDAALLQRYFAFFAGEARAPEGKLAGSRDMLFLCKTISTGGSLEAVDFVGFAKSGFLGDGSNSRPLQRHHFDAAKVAIAHWQEKQLYDRRMWLGFDDDGEASKEVRVSSLNPARQEPGAASLRGAYPSATPVRESTAHVEVATMKVIKLTYPR
jgi:hypothetical protein